MTGKLWRYLRWWVADTKSTTLVVTGPLSVIVGLLLVVASVVDGDPTGLLGSVVILLFGLLTMFGGVLHYRGKAKPWDASPPTEYGRT